MAEFNGQRQLIDLISGDFSDESEEEPPENNSDYDYLSDDSPLLAGEASEEDTWINN